MKKTLVVTMALALAVALPLAAAVVVEGQDAPQERTVERVVVVRAASPGGVERDPQVFVVKGEEGRLELKGGAGVHLLGPGGAMLHAGPGAFAVVSGRGFLGLELVEITPELRRHFGVAGEAGVLVGQVASDSPAERAGVRVGDVLTHVDGEEVGSAFGVLRKVRPLTEGQVVGLEVVRDGRVETVSATVTERELPRLEAGALMRRLGEEGESFTWELDPEELSKRMEKVTEYFSSPEWKAHVRELESTSRTLEERLAGLEEELRAREQKLQEDEPEE
jgi:membrane-associated protease RseP (regulator of RpoE activity)